MVLQLVPLGLFLKKNFMSMYSGNGGTMDAPLCLSLSVSLSVCLSLSLSLSLYVSLSRPLALSLSLSLPLSHSHTHTGKGKVIERYEEAFVCYGVPTPEDPNG